MGKKYLFPIKGQHLLGPYCSDLYLITHRKEKKFWFPLPKVGQPAKKCFESRVRFRTVAGRDDGDLRTNFARATQRVRWKSVQARQD